MKFEEQSTSNILELVAPFRLAIMRYWGIAWAPALVVFCLVLGLSLRLPDYYKSDAIIFIQPPKVSTEFFKKSEKKEEQTERLEALVQEIMSRPRLRKLIEQYDLYPDSKGIVGKEQALRRFRNEISIDPIVSPSGKSLTQTFRIEYVHNDPKMAFQITRALSDLFVEESIINQRAETQGTEEFLDSQLRKARKRLEVTEEKIQIFIRENFGKLPDHLDQAIQRLQNARAQLATNSQLISTNASRVGSIQREMRFASREAPKAGDVDTSDPRLALAQLEQALAVYRSKYSDRHPDVLNTKKRIQLLKKQLKSSGKDTSTKASLGSGSEGRKLRREMDEINIQTDALKRENENLKNLITRLEADINVMPIKEQELVKIKRDYDNVRESYQQLLAARDKAGLERTLVQTQQGTQFRIVDPAALPVIPAGPQRLIIAGIGVLVSLALFLIIPIGLHLLNDSFKYRDEVEKEMGLEVLGIIPPMHTPTAKAHFRRANSTSLIASVVAFFGGSLLILIAV